MKLFLRRNAPLFYVLAAMLALYIPWLNRGYLNYEWPHVLAGEALAYPAKIDLLKSYWSTGQANPLGYPLFNALLQRLVPWTDSPWLWRIPSLIGCGLIITWGWLVREEFGKNFRKCFYAWGLLVVTSPMIVAFSTHASSDLLPVGLLLISLWLLHKFANTQNFYQLLASACLFGFSSATRYIAPYFIGYVLYLILARQINLKKRIRNLIVFGLVSSIVLLSEIAWKFSSFGVLVSTQLDANGPNFVDFSNWSLVLLKYLSFIGMFCGTLPLVLAFKKMQSSDFRFRHTLFALGSVLLAIISTRPINEGELDFGGGFSYGVLFKFLVFAGFLNACFLVYGVLDQRKNTNEFDLAWLAGLVPYIVLISASRPVQRYLIYAIPIVLLILVEALDELPKKVKYLAVGSTALGFAAVSLLGMSYLTSQGNASEEMAVWVEENNLISQTSAGAISPHAGQHWWGVATDETRYEIIAVTPATESQVQERVLHREPMKVLGKVTRVYLLREITKKP
jgi:hypothetical protein